jgi:Tfp pilus assembly protein PilP
LRPQAILAAGEASRQAAEAASLAAQAAAQAAADAAVAEAAADVSPMAVSVSRIPAPRPRDLNRAVEAAVAAATQPAARAAPAASPQAERTEEEEEELDAVEVSSAAAPNIPTRADVARQATFVNAINLSRLNLIGVYGSNADRHALVRQANGRYVKVKVGDRLDGGTVRAITASEVRYQKGGRMIALAMPQG